MSHLNMCCADHLDPLLLCLGFQQGGLDALLHHALGIFHAGICSVLHIEMLRSQLD